MKIPFLKIKKIIEKVLSKRRKTNLSFRNKLLCCVGREQARKLCFMKRVTKDWNTAIKDSKKSFHIDVWPSSKQSLPLIFFSDPLKKGEVQYVAVETSASRFYSFTKTFRNLSRTKWVKVLISNINVYHNITGQSFFFSGRVYWRNKRTIKYVCTKLDSGKKKQTRFVILPTFLTMMLCNPRNITKKMTAEGAGYIRQNNFELSNVNSWKKYSVELNHWECWLPVRIQSSINALKNSQQTYSIVKALSS